MSWIALLIVTALATLMGLYVMLTPAPAQTQFATTTYNAFAAAEPEVAVMFARLLYMLGAAEAGFGILGALVAVMGLRRGYRWAWIAMWLYPVVYGLIGYRMLVDGYPYATWYLGFAALAALALAISARATLGAPGATGMPESSPHPA